jgi:hypothetical protein
MKASGYCVVERLVNESIDRAHMFTGENAKEEASKLFSELVEASLLASEPFLEKEILATLKTSALVRKIYVGDHGKVVEIVEVV